MASVINQIKLGNTEYAIAASAYAECSTAAGTAAKVATICTDSDTTNTAFTLIKGVSVQVKFSNTNSASSPTLNVNSTGAKSIYYKGAAITASYLKSNYTYTFVYNGTQWDLVGEINTDTNTQHAYYRSNPAMNGTASAGSSASVSRGDHVHPTDTSRAPTSHASSENTYGLGNCDNYGHVKLVEEDLNGLVGMEGQAAGLGHTHSQYASSYNDLTDCPYIPTESDITSSIEQAFTDPYMFNLDSLDTEEQSIIGAINELNANKANTSHTHSDQDITFGSALSISNGGTGATSASGARTSLGVPPTSHASTGTSYGVGTTTNYGHVKISNGDVNTVASADGLAAGMDHSHGNYMQKTAFSYNSTTGVLTITTT